MELINPANELVLGEYVADSPRELQNKLAASAAAFASWRDLPIDGRCRCLSRLAVVLRRSLSDLALIAAREMGKPLSAGETEVNKCAATCELIANQAPEILRHRPATVSGGRGYVRHDPLGAILAIMPWNYPYWQVFRFAVGALAAGNVVILKHAPNVPGCAAALEKMFFEADFPAGVLVSLRPPDNDAALRLCGDPAVAAITLTGSERAGAAVAAAAGAALKKTVMELGGSDAFIVLADADLQFAATSAAEARCQNSGQSCIAAKRFIVEHSVLANFQDALASAMNKRKIGDPMNRNTDLGPLARRDLLENLQRQVDESVQAGAGLVIGGKRLPQPGFFYPPTILSDVEPGMPAFDEETFGPVAALIGAAGTDEIVHLANASRFGLGASIWTRDLEKAERLAGKLNVGNVFINAIVRSDARLPFGGVKSSGWGRELAEEGLKEFTNVKTVWVNKP
jgi:acyl-CoA reductase-like NAD-dependent aldehyde dehydrogenase